MDFDVELAAVSLTPPTAQGQFIAPLPGGGHGFIHGWKMIWLVVTGTMEWIMTFHILGMS